MGRAARRRHCPSHQNPTQKILEREGVHGVGVVEGDAEEARRATARARATGAGHVHVETLPARSSPRPDLNHSSCSSRTRPVRDLAGEVAEQPAPRQLNVHSFYLSHIDPAIGGRE
jgi:hypothetical protein